jgi:hypothetical protein
MADAISNLGGGRHRHDNPFVKPQGDEENVSTKKQSIVKNAVPTRSGFLL